MQKAAPAQPESIVRTYGRGAVLGFLSLPIAFVMARLGMRGWEAKATREMEDDAVRMSRRGYRIATSEELGWPAFGVTWYRVRYERAAQAE
jgi:hypothetical protein